MNRIVTFTINPAVDVSAEVDRVVPTRKLRCGAMTREPGGGGINVARAIGELASEATAIYTAGGAIGALLEQLIAGQPLLGQAIPIADETRQSFAVFETGTGEQYRFVLPGPTLSPTECEACLAALEALSPAPDYLVASGSLPPGAPVDFYARVARIARRLGTRMVLDTSGPPLAAAVEEPIHLIKPNHHELSDLVGRALDRREDRVEAAIELVRSGKVEHVALTLGREGGLFVSHDAAWSAAVPDIEPVSAVGAGDCFVAGLVARLDQGASHAEAFRYGMAAGAAALLTPGTELCRKADVDRLVGEIVLTPLAVTA